MKKRNLLFLLIAVLCLSVMLFASCSDDGEEESHELLNYFVVEAEEHNKYTDVLKLQGELISVDEENDLVATLVTEVTPLNEVKQTIKVINLLTGDVLMEYECQKYSAHVVKEDYYTIYEYDVIFDYPAFIIEKDQISKSGSESELKHSYSYECYLPTWENKGEDASEVKWSLKSTKSTYNNARVVNLDDVQLVNNKVRGLYAYAVDGTTYYYDSDLKVLRTEKTVVANARVSEIDAEFGGYFYEISDDELMESSVSVYDKDGFLTAHYATDYTIETQMVAFVLNNGNVLIQVMSYEEGDENSKAIYYAGLKVSLNSYIMDYKTGALEEIELDYYVRDLESAHDAGLEDFPLELAEGKENQAFVYMIEEDGSIDMAKAEYVVLDNEGKIEYTVKNDTPNSMIDEMFVLMADRYVIPAIVGNAWNYNVYDLEGNFIATWYSDAYYYYHDFYDYEIVKDHIVTDYAIYDKNMKKVYSFSENGIVKSEDTEVCADNLFIKASSIVADTDCIYKFDFEKYELVQVRNGNGLLYYDFECLEVLDSPYGEYSLYAVWDEMTGVCTIYNVDGTVISTFYEDNLDGAGRTASTIILNFKDDNEYAPSFYVFR